MILSSHRCALKQYWRSAGVGLVLTLAYFAQATFHTWRINEIYSRADGSVQFIKLQESSGFNGENLLSGHPITCTNALGAHTYIFPANALSSGTANKTFLIGTSNLSSIPGGLKPDYTFTNAVPFLFVGSGTINYAGVDYIAYTNLPSDGVGSMVRSNGISGPMIISAKNSPKNFNAVSNSIVPVRFSSNAFSGGNLVFSFATATGTNGSTGPNYAIEFNSVLATNNWATLSNVTGNGTVKTISITTTNTQRLFRLRVP